MMGENIAIIPARIGSKRITKKNIKLFFGIPIIGYTINTLLDTKIFNKIIVSTDSDEIGQIALEYGAEFKELRPKELSDDFCGTLPVINYEINQIVDGGDNPVICCVYPTSCLIKPGTIINAFDTFKSHCTEILFSALRFSHPIQRAVKKNGELFYPEHFFSRTQDFEASFHDAGQFYFGLAKTFLMRNQILGEGSIPYAIDPIEAQDIDNEDDWRLAELKYLFSNNLSKK